MCCVILPQVAFLFFSSVWTLSDSRVGTMYIFSSLSSHERWLTRFFFVHSSRFFSWFANVLESCTGLVTCPLMRNHETWLFFSRFQYASSFFNIVLHFFFRVCFFFHKIVWYEIWASLWITLMSNFFMGKMLIGPALFFYLQKGLSDELRLHFIFP